MDAQGYYDSGRYDLADKRYGQILAIDPYNDAARKGQERVDLARAKGNDSFRYAQAHGGKLLADADRGRDLPATRNGAVADARSQPRQGAR